MHGATLNFLIWRLYYGVPIVIYQLIDIRGDWKPNTKLKTFFAWLVMFSFIIFGWGMFRAPSMAWFINVIFNSAFSPTRNELLLSLIALTMALVYSLPLMIKHLIDRYMPEGWIQASYYAIAMILVIIYINSANPDFIYFQF